MEFTWQRIKESARFNWKIGFALIVYFLFLALINILFKSEFLFKIFAWPNYVFPNHPGFAAIVEMIFAYIIGIFLVILFDEFFEVKEKADSKETLKTTSIKESTKKENSDK